MHHEPENDQTHIDVPAASAPAPKARRLSLIRSMTPADLLTLGNGTCGMFAVLFCIKYSQTAEVRWLWVAFSLLPVAFVLDALDGYVARAFHRKSPYGGDLDSLADIVSFGVAPATVGYTLGLNGGWDMVVLAVFVGCGISRLARFNVTAELLATDRGKVSHFEGTPIPTTLVIAGILAVALAYGRVQDSLLGGRLSLGWTLHPFSLLYAASGILMTTATLKIPKP